MDYHKAFDRVKQDRLAAEVLEKAGVPEPVRRIVISLYWRQYASVRWDGEVAFYHLCSFVYTISL